MYCLDDGSALLEGPGAAVGDESKTAVLNFDEATAASQVRATERGDISATATLAVGPTSSAEYIVGEAKRHKFLSLGIVAVLLGAVLAGTYFAFLAKRAAAFDSIVVLPFANASGDVETDFLSEGISETLINNFTRIPSLRVIARSTAFRYKGKDLDPQTIGRELNVGAILSGRVLQRGDALNIQVDLISAADGTQIWGNAYSSKASEVLDVEHRVARDVSEQLKLKLSGAEQRQMAKNYTQNADAYQSYLKGRFYWNKRTAENLTKAISEFQQAVDKDPNYALAFVGLADSYSLLEQYAGKSSGETLPQAKAYAMRALEIDEQLAEAHASLGLILKSMWQGNESEAEFKRAIELNPNYPTAHHWYCIYLNGVGRFEDGAIEIRRAQQLDPLSGVINVNVVVNDLVRGEVADAVEQGRKTVDLDPNYWQGHSWLAMAYLRQGHNAEALAEGQKGVDTSNGTNEAISFLGHVKAVIGDRDGAMAILKELEDRYARHEATGFNVAAVYVGFGDKDAAFAWLEKDFQARSGQLPFTRSYPTFESLRGDPRYADLLRRMNLPQ